MMYLVTCAHGRKIIEDKTPDAARLQFKCRMIACGTVRVYQASEWEKQNAEKINGKKWGAP